MNIEDNSGQKRKRNQSDDIDLSKVFSQVLKVIIYGLKSITKFIFALLDAIYADRKLILILAIAGMLLGVGYFYTTKPYYESRMTLNSEYYKGELLDNNIQNLNEVCSEGNYNLLADLLEISPSTSKKLKSIKVTPLMSLNYRRLINLYSSDDSYQDKLDSLLLYNNESNFQLSVEVYDTAALRGLDTVLVNYIKNNNYVRKRIQIDTTNLRNLRKKLMRESSSLDTLKRSISASIKSSGDAGRTGTNNVILGEKTVNPIDIYREDLEIYNRRQEIERQLALNAEIEVIEKFIPYSDPKSGSILINTMKGAIAGVILALLFVLYKLLRDGLIRLRYNLN